MKTAAAKASPPSPKFPSELSYLWRWFLDLCPGFLLTGMGPSVLTWEGLDAWCRLMRIQLSPWEADCLMRLSMARAVVQNERYSKPGESKSAVTESARRPR